MLITTYINNELYKFNIIPPKEWWPAPVGSFYMAENAYPFWVKKKSVNFFSK